MNRNYYTLFIASLFVWAGCQDDGGLLGGGGDGVSALSKTPVFAPFADQAAAIHYVAETTVTYEPIDGATTDAVLGVPEKTKQDVVLYVAKSGEFKMQIDDLPASEDWSVEHRDLANNQPKETRSVIEDGEMSLLGADGKQLLSTPVDLPLLTEFADNIRIAKQTGEIEPGKLITSTMLQGDNARLFALMDSIANEESLAQRDLEAPDPDAEPFVAYTLPAAKVGISHALPGGQVTVLFETATGRALSIEVYDLRGRRVNGIAFDYGLVVDDPDALLAMQQQYLVEADPRSATAFYVTTVTEYDKLEVVIQ